MSFDEATVEQLLLKRWDGLRSIGDDHSMSSEKIRGRLENMRYEHPFIYFDIERHGAMVNGSKYGDVHSWRVDLDRNEAEIVSARKRLLYAKARRFDVKPLARQIADAIANRVEDARLKWVTEDRVRVLINDVIPETNQQTTSSRRKRFRTELDRLLSGWEESSPNVYGRKKLCSGT